MQTQGWNYYEFNVTEEDYQIVVNVAAEEDSGCELHPLYAKQSTNIILPTVRQQKDPECELHELYDGQ